MNNEDLDSQLSAMFDGELPDGECELVARRLARDAELRKRWHHYAVIGAALRSEGAMHLDDRLALRIRASIAAEPELAGAAVPPAAGASPPSRARSEPRWLRPVAAVGIAASVAALSVLWLRAQAPVSVPAAAPLTASTAVSATSAAGRAIPAAPAPAESSAPVSYTVPPDSVGQGGAMAPAELANYVVAHSEYSSPLTRRFPLSAIVSSEASSAAGATPVEFVQEPAADAAPTR